MPSFGNPDQANRNVGWQRIARTVLVQVLVLLALAAAVIYYVNWSSEAAWAEFTTAIKAPVLSPIHQPPVPTPVQTVKGQKTCPRKV